jgi:hypothetical protein
MPPDEHQPSRASAAAGRERHHTRDLGGVPGPEDYLPLDVLDARLRPKCTCQRAIVAAAPAPVFRRDARRRRFRVPLEAANRPAPPKSPIHATVGPRATRGVDTGIGGVGQLSKLLTSRGRAERGKLPPSRQRWPAQAGCRAFITDDACTGRTLGGLWHRIQENSGSSQTAAYPVGTCGGAWRT